MRVIFVPVADRPECAQALQTAFELGKKLGASVNGCHIRPHSYSRVSLPYELVELANEDAAWSAALKAEKKPTTSKGAKALFEKVAAHFDYRLIKRPGLKPGAIWTEKLGSPDKLLSIVGPVSDLIIVSRPATRSGQISRLFALAALLKSSRPVLLLPPRGSTAIGKRICIAWNQSGEAALAVSAAMPLLQLADQVSIVTCGAERGLGPKSAQLASYLKFWGVNAECVKASGRDEAKALVSAFRKKRADLLVMGAYSRSRLRQRVFGGVTDYMLQSANIPVLMLHA